MESFQLYKSLYDRELRRRIDLDESINIPLTILTLIIAANSYIINKANNVTLNCFWSFTSLILLFAVFIAFSISIYFLLRSFNNFFRGFVYRNLPLSTEIRNFELNLRDDENREVIFENRIIEEINIYTDSHKIFNDKRSLDLYKAKSFITVTLLITATKFLIVILHNGIL